MATSDEALNAHFADEYNKLLSLYNDGGSDDLRKCIAGAHKLLEEPVIPSYHHIKTLILLGATVADPDEAWLFYRQALTKWQVVRSCSPKGHDDRIDEPMSELEESMEEVKGVLVAELADLYDVPGDDFEALEDEIINAALERQAEQLREATLDAEAVLQADERALGKTRKEILEFDASKEAAENVRDRRLQFIVALKLTGIAEKKAEPHRDDSIDKSSSVIDDLRVQHSSNPLTGYARDESGKPSAKAQASSDNSRALGSGGADQPFKSPLLSKSVAESKPVDELEHAIEPTMDVSEFHSKDGHDPVLTRAKSKWE
ncbi:hypothetical protein LTR95_005579 [Oleoguttula sp. CCFEE 5521]